LNREFFVGSFELTKFLILSTTAVLATTLVLLDRLLRFPVFIFGSPSRFPYGSRWRQSRYRSWVWTVCCSTWS
jgi:hypothetical protein